MQLFLLLDSFSPLKNLNSVPSESDIISPRHFLCRALLQRDFVYVSKANITKLGKIVCLEDPLSAYICCSSFCEEGVKAFSGRTMMCQPCDLLYIYVFIYIYEMEKLRNYVLKLKREECESFIGLI